MNRRRSDQRPHDLARYVDVVAHADWSIDPDRRWLALARREGPLFQLDEVGRVGDASIRLSELRQGRAVLGLDVPIGLPNGYAERTGITQFLPWLRGLDATALDRWATAAAEPDQISLARPFYPARPGGRRVADLVTALDLSDRRDLLRACDRSPPLTRPAAALFWTLGPNQVGRAATSCWRELVRPPPDLTVWPFDGTWPALVADGERATVLAEVYPAEAARWLGVQFGAGASKRRPSDRAMRAGAVLAAGDELGVRIGTDVRQRLQQGFLRPNGGDDAFDAVLGVLGMVAVLRGRRAAGPPEHAPAALTVEGWILGAG